MGRLSIDTTPNPIILPQRAKPQKFGIPQNIPFKLRPYGCRYRKSLQLEVLGRDIRIQMATPKIGDLQTPPLNYIQTVADGTTLRIDRLVKS